jgi:large subunit ribosomal protein L23
MSALLDKFKKKAPTDPKNGSAKSKAKVVEATKELSVSELETVKAKQAVVNQVAQPAVKAAAKKEDTRQAYSVIVKPLITEKGTYLNSQGKYLFQVAARTNKVEVAKAIYYLYNVRPVKVNIIKKLGKHVTYGRVKGRTSDWKKAVVTMPKGVQLSVYEGV